MITLVFQSSVKKVKNYLRLVVEGKDYPRFRMNYNVIIWQLGQSFRTIGTFFNLFML